MQWATADTMAYPGSTEDVPDELNVPHWTWDGLVTP
jgi:hypothetical protein